jgi:hypothetical protein
VAVDIEAPYPFNSTKVIVSVEDLKNSIPPGEFFYNVRPIVFM